MNISKIDRDIADIRSNLSYLNNTKFPDDLDYLGGDAKGSTILDRKSFEKILSLGSDLSLNEYRIETLKKLGKIQTEKNALKKIQDLQRVNLAFDKVDVTLKFITERILQLGKQSNDAVTQVRSLTQPKKSIKFIRNPELVESSLNTNFIKIISILSLIGFFCISSIAILIPNRKN